MAEHLKAHAFKKGQSGNPGGKAKSLKPLVDLAREHSAEALEKIIALMRASDDERVQLAAAQTIIERGYGKATQAVDMSMSPSAGFLDLLKVISASSGIPTGTLADSLGEQSERPEAVRH